MSFPELTTRRRSLCVFDLLVLVFVCALPLAGISPPSAPGAPGLSTALLFVGYLLWWLPGLGVRRGRIAPLVLPIFVGLAFLYLMVLILAFLLDPTLAILVLASQLIAMLYTAFRF
jgi:hypothetical protein